MLALPQNLHVATERSETSATRNGVLGKRGVPMRTEMHRANPFQPRHAIVASEGTPPAPKGSGTRTKSGWYQEQAGPRLKAYQAAIERDTLAVTLQRGWTPLAGALRVTLTIEFPRPKRHYLANGTVREDAPRRPYPCKRGDIDKLERAVLDAIVKGMLMHDDNQIVDLQTSLYWSMDRKPRTSIVAAELGQ